jgi:hypothetical protein
MFDHLSLNMNFASGKLVIDGPVLRTVNTAQSAARDGHLARRSGR